MSESNHPAGGPSWDLSDLYSSPSDPGIESDLAKAGRVADDFAERYRGRVAGLPPAGLLQALRALEAIQTIAYRPAGYAQLAFSAQTQDPRLQSLLSRVREASTEISNKLVFFDVDLKGMPDEAFSRFTSSSKLAPFIGRLDDVFTLAHELGHAVHFYLAREQTPLNFGPTTPMAEVASVFGELLLGKHLREREPDVSVRRNILSGMIEDAVSTIMRQVMYTRWERRAHARRAAGVATPDEYGALWMEENRRLYGDSVIFGDLDRWGWITIPHFVNYRFYCYSYAFGHLLNFALYRKYLEEGESFAPEYLELLASGGGDRSERLVGAMGMDVLDPGFWDAGFDFLEGLLGEFKEAVAA